MIASRAPISCAAALLAWSLTANAGAVTAAAPERSAPILVDDFEDARRWSARPADGVELTLHSDAGLRGQSLRLDFRFVKGGGYAVIHRDLALELPKNYRFRFHLRGQCPSENLEFKLIDSTGENVWWSNQRNFVYPALWDSVTLKKRQIGFAWGPQGGGEIHHVAAIEFAVTAGSGGAGSVWLDDLTLEELPPPGMVPPRPIASASSSQPGHEAAGAADGDSATFWQSRPGDGHPELALDLGTEREFGGLVIEWVPGRRLSEYAVEVSEDGAAWRSVREVRGGQRLRDYLYLPESETRQLRIRALPGAGDRGCAIREITVEPLEFGASLENFYAAIAKDAPRGSYPRGISGEQPYWTVLGVQGDHEKVLFSEDGAIETGKASFSVEPFLFADGKLLTWADVESKPARYGERPTLYCTGDSLRVEIKPLAYGLPGAAAVFVQYEVQNLARRKRDLTLYLALRPFQVNPPAQFLNTPGGTAPIRELTFDGRVVRADNRRGVIALTRPSGFGAATFDRGDIVDFLRVGRLPESTHVRDPFEHAAGALAYRLKLGPHDLHSVLIEIPLADMPPRVAVPSTDDAALRLVWHLPTDWEMGGMARADHGPKLSLFQTAGDVQAALDAQLAYILIDRDGPALQPGARAYARAWIRDGALISSALLRFGYAREVRDFIEWFASHQYANGKIPCCVDQRGSDPVPENDSHGEFIYLVAEYYRLTGDFGLLERMWPHVESAAIYLDSLRQQRRTPEWRAPEKRQFFGLLPPSISHEGYSAKPMHSYWDDLFALRAFKDAAYIAAELGLADQQRRYSATRDDFAGDLRKSIQAAMAAHRIDFIPGCADLGDFDATSTTIALEPVQAESVVPRAALDRTFEKYWQFFKDRRDGQKPWDAFTPYEMRAIGAFVRLGWRDRANQLLDFFMKYRRPQGWQQWPEVVWKDERAPHFIGDLPHTWVGSDFIRSVLDMVAYERESDDALVLGAGVPRDWLDPPARSGGMRTVGTLGLVTRYGNLSYTMDASGDSIRVSIVELTRIPAGGIVVSAPTVMADWKATINGRPAIVSRNGEVVVREVPARVVMWP